MKNFAVGLLLLFFLIPATGLAADDPQFYTGATGGIVVPGKLHEHWNNTDGSGETADLAYELNNGFLVGAKFGCTPVALKKILAVEFEYTYQKADLNTVSTSGFTAFGTNYPAFSSDTINSHIDCHSFFFNIMARYPKGSLHPYVGIGPGITRSFICDHIEEPVHFNESDSDSTFSYQVLVGVDFDVTAQFSLGGGYRYFAVKPTITWASGAQSKFDYSSNNLVFEAKYHF